VADAIMDRLVHNAYKINLKGDSGAILFSIYTALYFLKFSACSKIALNTSSLVTDG